MEKITTEWFIVLFMLGSVDLSYLNSKFTFPTHEQDAPIVLYPHK